jgi:flagellar basal-body rod protein FlgB
MSGKIFDKTGDALSASINFRLLRNNVVSGNIANAETPGYKAKKLDFEEALSRAVDLNGLNGLNTDHGDHFPVGPGSISRLKVDVYDNPDVNISNDGNTVDLEREMSALAENTILYKAALKLINKKMAALKYAVSEGGR